MRFNEILSESAVKDLAKELPNLKKHDYDTIDQLMQRISRRYKITGAKLHDLFVSKYGHTPDHWIKKYKNKLGEEETDESILGFMMKPEPQKLKPKLDYDAVRKMSQGANPPPNVKNTKDIDKDAKVFRRMAESIEDNDQMQQVTDFVKWSIKTLSIQKPYPKITLSTNTDEAQEGHHTGRHTSDGRIWVYVENRNMVDIFRTIFHELVHHRQDQLNMIGPDDSYPGSPVEAMADMMAGKYIKIYGKNHPEIFQ